MLVGVRRTVKPACGILAGVGEVLLGCGTQQFQKGHLDDINRVPISVDVGKLNDTKKITTGITQIYKCTTLWHNFSRALCKQRWHNYIKSSSRAKVNRKSYERTWTVLYTDEHKHWIHTHKVKWYVQMLRDGHECEPRMHVLPACLSWIGCTTSRVSLCSTLLISPTAKERARKRANEKQRDE